MSDSVRSVERIFDLLEILTQERAPIGLTELAERASLSKTTTHRLLQTMCSREYAGKTDNSKYFLGPKVIELASFHIVHLELHQVAIPLLAELYSKLGLSVYLGKMVRNKVVYTELMNHNIVLDNIEKGSGIPAYPSGIGKCLIASLSGDELDEMLYTYPLSRYTDHTITDVTEYRKHLKKVRTLGWAVNDEETIIGMRFVAAPVYDFRGAAIAGISVSGSLTDINDDNLEQIANTVVNTAAIISRRMGYLP